MNRIPLFALRNVLVGAGKIVSRGFHQAQQVSQKSDGSPVTQTDRLTDEFLRKHLLRLTPEAGWLSEESNDDTARLRKDLVWIVDPIDGTKEFIQRVPELAISVALVQQGKVILGAVYNPLTLQGAAANHRGEKSLWGVPEISARTPMRLSVAHAALSRTELNSESVTPYTSLFGSYTPVGSIAYRLLRVAVGIDDITVSTQPKSEWDLCGGVALVRFLGKAFETWDGSSLSFNQPRPRIQSEIVAGPEHLVREFRESLSFAKKKAG